MSSLRLLMICHDNNGISKTSRAMKIATHISESMADCSILVLTDLSIIGKFRFPQNVDFVHLPGLIYKSNREFRAKNLNIESKNVLRIRRKIVESTAKSFKPHCIVVEADLNKLSVAELYKSLRALKDHLVGTRIIWGLPDVLGDPDDIKKIWNRFKISAAFERVVDEIWVYGNKNGLDFAKAYRMPRLMAKKLRYMGYLRSPVLSPSRISREVARRNFKKPFVLLNAGSGLDGFPLIESFVQYLESEGDKIPFHSLIITGPMMQPYKKSILARSVEKLPNVSIRRFCKQLSEYIKYADLVLSTGGYNSLCEILSYRKKTIIVPAGGIFNEHSARAKLVAGNGLVSVLPLNELSPENLGNMIDSFLANIPNPAVQQKQADFPMQGLDCIVERLKDLNGVDNYSGK